MTLPRTIPNGLSAGLIRRVMWCSLLLVHLVPAMTASAAWSAMALWLVIGFFALKAWDVPWLRWRLRRSSTLTLLLVVGLAHADMKPDAAALVLVAELPAAVVTVAAMGAVRDLARRLPRVLDRFLAALRPRAELIFAWNGSMGGGSWMMGGRLLAPVAAARPPPPPSNR